MKRFAAGVLSIVSLIGFSALAETPATRPTPIVVPLNDVTPNPASQPLAERDDGTGRIWNVSKPTMLVYLPSRPTPTPRMAIIFCPGGGYTHLTRLEGADGFVDEFAPNDIVVVSLKHRLKPASTDVERDASMDACQAIRLLRQHAAEWHVDPRRIGLAGASAGANVVLNVASQTSSTDSTTRWSLSDARPDFVVLLSPWPDGHDIAAYPIGHAAPPAFIASARDDKTAPPAFAEAIAKAYQAAGAPAEMWLVDTGGHGAFTIGGSGEGAGWPTRFRTWVNKAIAH